MRRFFLLIGLFGLIALSLASLASAGVHTSTIPVTPPSPDPPEPLELELDLLSPQAISADPAADECAAASELTFVYDSILQSGGVTDVSSYSTSASDPLLSCMTGSPPTLQGFRSAWYRFTAPVDGRVTVRAATNVDYKRNYDTVIAIYRDDSSTPGACGTLTQVACNDDFDALLSKATANVEAGETYLVEVVDRLLAVPGRVELNLEATLDPAPTWKTVASQNQLINPLTRHAVVISGTEAYVMGGTTNVNRNGRFRKYDLAGGVWTDLATWKAGNVASGSGYANTDAVIVKDQIHIPAGGVGAGANYDGAHWVYSITDNTWQTLVERGGPQLDWGSSGAGAPVGYTQLVEYQSGSQTGYYMVGGLTGNFLGDPAQVNPTNIFYRYLDTGISRSWQVSLPQMSRSRYAHVAERIGNFICVVGGLTVSGSSNVIITDGECYDEGSGSWLPNVNDMITPRYLAGSAVGPGGQWYVFGGISAAGEYVSTIEVYDFATGQWSEMPPQFDIDAPSLAWMRGDFVGSTLWLFGGEQQGSIPVPLIQSKSFPTPFIPISVTGQIYMPLINHVFAQPKDSPLGAPLLQLGVPVHDTFEGFGDVYQVYRVNWGGGNINLSLTDVPHGSDYDLLLFTANKVLFASSQNIGTQNELIAGDLTAGSYFVMVARAAPPPSQHPSSRPYRLLLGN